MKLNRCAYPDCDACGYVDCRLNDVMPDEMRRQDSLDREILNDEKRASMADGREIVLFMYNHSRRGKERSKRFAQSEKGKILAQSYEKSEKGKARRDRYRKSDKGKATLERYLNSEKGKAMLQRKYEKRRLKRKEKIYETA